MKSLAGGNDSNTSPLSITLPHEKFGLIATILTLAKGIRQDLLTGVHPAMFAVFVQNPEVIPPFPGEAFAQLYGLTPAELRISLAMSPGLSAQEAANDLGLSVTTVKSHLQHMFAKTRTSKQSDLMQLLMRTSAPITTQ